MNLDRLPLVLTGQPSSAVWSSGLSFLLGSLTDILPWSLRCGSQVIIAAHVSRDGYICRDIISCLDMPINRKSPGSARNTDTRRYNPYDP